MCGALDPEDIRLIAQKLGKAAAFVTAAGKLHQDVGFQIE